jgi:hypothetical protein
MFYDNKTRRLQTYVLMSWIRIDFYGSRLRSWSFPCVTFHASLFVHALWVFTSKISQTSLGICNARVSAPNKSPNKSHVFSKLSSWAHLPPFKTLVTAPSLTLGARAANLAGTARIQASTHACHPSAAVCHRAGNPAHAAVPPAGLPRHHRRPENHADARKSENPAKPFPLIFLAIFPNF